MATFVLVHPAWFGGWCWKKIAGPLRDAGHAVHLPTLTGLGDRDHLASPAVSLATHIERVYFRSVDWPAPQFDDFGASARSTPGWTYHELHASHIPYVSHPNDVIDLPKGIIA